MTSAHFCARPVPWGLILFKRNIQDRDQVIGLVREALHELRLKRPFWSTRRAAGCSARGRRIGRLIPPAQPMARSTTATRRRALPRPARRAADRRRSARARHQCRLPAARRRSGAGADRVIGDRAYGENAGKVAAIGRAVAEGLPPAACCRCSSTSPATAGPPPTATKNCRWSHADRATLEATDFAAFRPLKICPWR